jgi:hypothetical protein
MADLPTDAHGPSSNKYENNPTGDDAAQWQPGMRPLRDLGDQYTLGAAGVPTPHAWLVASSNDANHALACQVVADGFVVHFGFASVVLRSTGEISDVFPSNLLRVVGGSPEFLTLAKINRFYDQQLFVRDVIEHRWLTGSIPSGLPNHSAGVLPDRTRAVVIDHETGVYYDIESGAISGTDMVHVSACGRYVWDSVAYIREAASGRPVLDARSVVGDVISFARTVDGWRFVMQYEPDEEEPLDVADVPWLRLLTETGEIVRELNVDRWGLNRWDVSPLALSADGTRLIEVTDTSLDVFDADSGQFACSSIDLTPLHPALELLDDTELWTVLASTYAVPSVVAQQTLDSIFADLTDTFAGASLSDTGISRSDIAAAISAAADRPVLPTVLPLIDRV